MEIRFKKACRVFLLTKRGNHKQLTAYFQGSPLIQIKLKLASVQQILETTYIDILTTFVMEQTL